MTTLLDKISKDLETRSAEVQQRVAEIKARQWAADGGTVDDDIQWVRDLAATHRAVIMHDMRQGMDTLRAELGLPSRTAETFRGMTDMFTEMGNTFRALTKPLVDLAQELTRTLSGLEQADFTPWPPPLLDLPDVPPVEDWTLGLDGLPLVPAPPCTCFSVDGYVFLGSYDCPRHKDDHHD